MRVAPVRPARVARRLFLLGILAAFCGCQREEEIQQYTATKALNPPLPKKEKVADSGGGSTRLLGAIISRGDGLWVFKIMGPEDAVKPHEAEFETFIDSVTFKGDKPGYKVPEGWQETKGTQFSVAAFRVGPGGDAPVLTVTPTRGSVSENVNRWRGQLSLKPVDEAGLKEVTKEKKVGDATAVLVNMTGTGSGGMGGPPFAGKTPPFAGRSPHGAAAAGPKPKIQYTLPPGWEVGGELVKAGIPRVAVFQVKDGGKTAEVTITIVGGGLRANILRWRDQVGLGPVDDEQLAKDAKPMLIAGDPGVLVDLSGDGSPNKPGILGAMTRRGGEDWYFKLTGTADVAAKQRSAFEAFLKSVRFEGGDAHE